MITKEATGQRGNWGLLVVNHGNWDDWIKFDLIEVGRANTGSQLEAATIERQWKIFDLKSLSDRFMDNFT